MESLGFENDEIKKFADANYWLKVFPHCAKKDLQRMGVKVKSTLSFSSKNTAKQLPIDAAQTHSVDAVVLTHKRTS